METATQSQEQVIESLVLAKRERSALSLVQLNADDRERMLRADYLTASDAGLILFFNLALQMIGEKSPSAKSWTWTKGSLRASYDADAMITIVSVGDVVVLSNEMPGRERLIAGQWMHTIYDAAMAVDTRKQSEASRAALRQGSEQINDMLADV